MRALAIQCVRTQIFAREALLVAIVLLVISAPWLIESTALAWVAIGGLLAFAAVTPRSLLIAVVPAIGLSFKSFELGTLEFNILEILVGVAVVGYLPRFAGSVWRHRSEISVQPRPHFSKLFPDPVAAGIAGLFLVAGVLSLITVADPDHLRESLRYFRWTVLIPVLYFSLSSAALPNRELRPLLVAMFVAGGVIASVIALFDRVMGGGVAADSVVRLSGLAPHPNALSLYLERVAVLGLLIGLLYRSRLPLTWLVPSVLVALVTVLTFSRGAVLATAVACVIVLAIAQSRRLAAIATGIAAVVLVVVATLAPARTLSLLGGGSGSLRLELWRSSTEMIRDHILTGVGLDQFLYQYLPRYVSPAGWPERFTSHPHNLVLEVWLSLGIIGLALLVLVGAFWLTRMRAAIARQDRIALASGGALLAVFLHGLIDRSYFLPELAISFWFLMLLMHPGVDRDPDGYRRPADDSEG